MSITDELRKYAQDWRENPNLMDDLDAGDVDGILADFERIADRIDAEHQKAIADVMNDALYYANEKKMAELGWMRLPKDADGEYIHIGDVMDGTCPSGKHVNGTVNAIGDGVFWLSNVQFSLKPDYMHHHNAPTVEDVLREFGDKYCDVSLGSDAESELFAEYAAKLRLAGDAE